MGRVRLAIALLLTSAVGAASFLPSTNAGNEGRHYSHRITVLNGEVVDHWTVADPAPCQSFGDGTLTVNFRFVKTKLVRLVLDPYHNGEPNNTFGSWVVGIPGPTGGIRDMPAQPATGTITLVDNTAQNPPLLGHSDCVPADKSGCGTFVLSRVAKSSISGYNRRFLKADLLDVQFAPRRGGCHVGLLSLFTERLAGGTRLGELLLRMPSVSTVAHRRVLIVTGTSHKLTSFPDCGSSNSCSDDVTRRVSVTFKHL